MKPPRSVNDVRLTYTYTYADLGRMLRTWGYTNQLEKAGDLIQRAKPDLQLLWLASAILEQLMKLNEGVALMNVAVRPMLRAECRARDAATRKYSDAQNAWLNKWIGRHGPIPQNVRNKLCRYFADKNPFFNVPRVINAGRGPLVFLADELVVPKGLPAHVGKKGSKLEKEYQAWKRRRKGRRDEPRP